MGAIDLLFVDAILIDLSDVEKWKRLDKISKIGKK
jgi:hypothetical protein